jgi:hypothetical protein
VHLEQSIAIHINLIRSIAVAEDERISKVVGAEAARIE